MNPVWCKRLFHNTLSAADENQLQSIKRLAPELFFFISAHSVYKM